MYDYYVKQLQKNSLLYLNYKNNYVTEPLNYITNSSSFVTLLEQNVVNIALFQYYSIYHSKSILFILYIIYS